MSISSQYVFELQFYGDNCGEKQFVIIDGESMADFSKLKDDLSKCTPDPFRVQYIDDEDDIVSIDTEEEFIEFAKLAKHRSSRGMLIKLILNSYDLSSDSDRHVQIPSQPQIETKQLPKTLKKPEQKLEVGAEGVSESNDMAVEADHSDYIWITKKELCEMVDDLKTLNSLVPDRNNGAIKKTAVPNLLMRKPVTKQTMMDQSEFDQFKSKIKAELKEEILSEMKSEISASNDKVCTKSLETKNECEEDSDGNLVQQKRKAKHTQCQKKLEKKEKNSETKIDQRLEKLEMKKKKLLEKSHRLSTNRTPVVDSNNGLPYILSAVATANSSTLAKKVTIGKVFIHAWQVINDGTVPWNNVELRHTWSSPGLEPDELSVKCLSLPPGGESVVMVKFKAPKTVGGFISYWHFCYPMDGQWQQFGHYVSVTGNTKLSNKLVPTTNKVTVSAATPVGQANQHPNSTSKEVKVVNEMPTEMAIKKQLEASLASSEIAAEMAREAANAAFRQAIGNQGARNTMPNDSKQAEKDDTVSSVQRLNLEETGSDTDGNLDANEETDPGFVIVNIPSGFATDQSKVQNVELAVFPEDKTVKGPETNNINNNKNADNIETFVMERRENEAIPNEAARIPLSSRDDKKEDGNGANLLKRSVPDNQVPVAETFEKQAEAPVTYPRSDPNVNCPLFRPPRSHVYPIPPHHPGHNQPFAHVPLYNGPAHISAPPPAPMPHFPLAPKMVPPFMAYQYPMNAHPPAIHGFPPTMPSTPQMGYPQINPTVSSETFPMGPPIFQGSRKYYHYSSPSTPDSNGKIFYASASTENTQPTTTSNFSENHPSAVQPQSETQLEQGNQPESLDQPQLEAQPQPKPQPQPMAQPQQMGTEKKEESGVQLLPQGLVDGAINVAASAYSTAWNALNNLRPKEGDSVDFDPVFENNMALLVEMGFTNLNRNAMLLKRFHNDVNRVIGVICASGGGEGLNID